MSRTLLLFVQLGARLYIGLTALNRIQGQLEGSESASRGKKQPRGSDYGHVTIFSLAGGVKWWFQMFACFNQKLTN